MNHLYAYNPGRAPHITGTQVFPAEAYTVVTPSMAVQVREGKLPISLEGDSDFVDVWVRYHPAKTPDQFLPK